MFTMGRVFTTEEVACGLYPASIDEHKIAAATFIEGIDTINEERPASQQIAGLVYGSVALGLQSRRSDLDALVILPDEDAADTGLAVGRLLADIREQTHVSSDMSALSRSAAREGSHLAAMDGLFVEHLQFAERKSPYVAGRPSEYMPSLEERFPDPSLRTLVAHAITQAYIEGKKAKRCTHAPTLHACRHSHCSGRLNCRRHLLESYSA